MIFSQNLPQVDIPPDMIHLGLGQPGIDLLPLTKLEKAASLSLSKEERSFLAYGEEKGNRNFRETLSQFLTERYPEPVDPDQLFITNGNSQALDFICTLFTRPGDTILVEEPSYFLALKIFADRGLKMVTVPVDENGLKTDVLEEKLSSISPSFLYTIPTFHNPASVTLSAQRRDEMIRLCKKKGLPIVADEVYHFLNYANDPPPLMGTWIGQGPVISLGSFSKILAPGLRLGWIHTSRDLVNKMAASGLLQSGGGFNPFTSEIVNSFIQKGFLASHIKKLKTVYGKRLGVLCEQLHKYLPEKAVFQVPEGGYFIWLKLPDNIDTKAMRSSARKQNVDFNPGSYFSSKKGLKNYLRLSFSFYDEANLTEGAKRLGKVISYQL